MYRRHQTVTADFSRKVDDVDEDGGNSSASSCGHVSANNDWLKHVPASHDTTGLGLNINGSKKQQQVDTMSSCEQQCHADADDSFAELRSLLPPAAAAAGGSSRRAMTSSASSRQTVAMATRSMSTSSVMWTKVRERIMNKVIQPDWSHPAVVAQERQRRRVYDTMRYSTTTANKRIPAVSSSLTTAAAAAAGGNAADAGDSVSVTTVISRRQAGSRKTMDRSQSFVDDSHLATSSQRRRQNSEHSLVSASLRAGDGETASPGTIVCSGQDLNAILERYKKEWCVHETHLDPDLGLAASMVSVTTATEKSLTSADDISFLAASASGVSLDKKDNCSISSSCSTSHSHNKRQNPSANQAASATSLLSNERTRRVVPPPVKDKQSSASDIISLSDVLYSQLAEPANVTFDDQGQTWEVYGAEFDPSVLGAAIQKRLTKMMSVKSEDKPDLDTLPPVNRSVQSFALSEQQELLHEEKQEAEKEKDDEEEAKLPEVGEKMQIVINVDENHPSNEGGVRHFLRILCSLAFRRRGQGRIDHV